MRAQQISPDDPVLARLLTQISRTVPIRTEPAGATVSYKDYAHPESDWRVVGVTPLDSVSVPATMLRWRFEKPGYETVEAPRLTGPFLGLRESTSIDATLTATGSAPPGMVLVAAAPGAIPSVSARLRASRGTRRDERLLDRPE